MAVLLSKLEQLLFRELGGGGENAKNTPFSFQHWPFIVYLCMNMLGQEEVGEKGGKGTKKERYSFTLCWHLICHVVSTIGNCIGYFYLSKLGVDLLISQKYSWSWFRGLHICKKVSSLGLQLHVFNSTVLYPICSTPAVSCCWSLILFLLLFKIKVIFPQMCSYPLTSK